MATSRSEPSHDIRDAVELICSRLGLEPSDVARLEIRPGEVSALIYLRNENGSKYLTDPENKRDPAMTERHFPLVLT